MSKIGLFGGSFNPPHIGHLIIAQEALHALNLERILFMPTNLPPHKRCDVAPELRYEMTCIAIAGNPSFEVTDVELARGGTSYTADTLRDLSNRFRGTDFYLLVGADEFAEIETWKEPETVLTLSSLVVMLRPGVDLAQVSHRFKDKCATIKVPLIEISSTYVRELVRQGRNIQYVVPPGVAEFIEQKKLYR